MSVEQRRERDRLRKARQRARKREAAVEAPAVPQRPAESGTHVEALRTTVDALGVTAVPMAVVYVELAFTLARRWDRGVPPSQEPRLLREYLNLLRLLREFAPGPTTDGSAPAEPSADASVSDFEDFKRRSLHRPAGSGL